MIGSTRVSNPLEKGSFTTTKPYEFRVLVVKNVKCSGQSICTNIPVLRVMVGCYLDLQRLHARMRCTPLSFAHASGKRALRMPFN